MGLLDSKMSALNDALAKLLRDDDPETVRLVKRQLAESGEDSLPQLRQLCRMDDASVSFHAREVIAEITGRSAEEEFALLCHFFGDGLDLEQAWWALSRALEPDVCTTSFEKKINAWGRQFLVKISSAVSNRERVRLLSEFISGELDFRGNTENYYCVRNSVLPQVIETRTGIPITLTLLYMMIGARAAMKIEGINLPGHFVARHGEVFFDPFHRGRILTRCDIEQILLRQGIELRECHLRPATPRQMLVRMLANVLYVYDITGDRGRHAMVHGWIHALACGRPGE